MKSFFGLRLTGAFRRLEHKKHNIMSRQFERVISVLPAPEGLVKTMEDINGEPIEEKVLYIIFSTDDAKDAQGRHESVNMHCIVAADIADGFYLFKDQNNNPLENK